MLSRRRAGGEVGGAGGEGGGAGGEGAEQRPFSVHEGIIVAKTGNFHAGFATSSRKRNEKGEFRAPEGRQLRTPFTVHEGITVAKPATFLAGFATSCTQRNEKGGDSKVPSHRRRCEGRRRYEGQRWPDKMLDPEPSLATTEEPTYDGGDPAQWAQPRRVNRPGPWTTDESATR